MKKYLAALLIAVMAVSVISAAGVVTAQKAEATPPTKGATTVPYKAGTTYAWTPTQFNLHNTQTIVSTPEKTQPPKVQVWSRWGTGSTSVQITKTATPISERAEAFAYVGVVVTVTPKDGYRFTGYEPVTVTYNGKYTFSALGPDVNTECAFWDETFQHDYHSVHADGSGTAVTDSGTFGTPDAHPLYWFGTYDQATGNYKLTLPVIVLSSASGVSQASATVDVSSIELQFNELV